MRILPLVVALLALSAATSQASASTVPIGLYSGPGNVAATTSWSQSLGEPVSYGSDYVPYTNGWSTDFDPQWLLDPWGSWVNAAPGRRVVLGVPMLENGYAGEFSQEAAGAFDPYFSELASELVQHGLANTVIRLGYEANNPDIGPWQATDNPAGFIAAYRHIVAVMRAVPGANFLFDWNPTAGLTPGKPLNSFASFYPGDDVVDIIGLDVYDIDWNQPAATPQQRWSNLLNETMGLEAQRTFAAAHGKPVSFPEWGLYADQSTLYAGGGDDPYYVNQMAAWIASGNTAYQTYFDLNWGGGVLADYPLGQAAYLTDFGPASTPPVTVPPVTTPNTPTVTPVPTPPATPISTGAGNTGTGTAGTVSTGTGSNGTTGSQGRHKERHTIAEPLARAHAHSHHTTVAVAHRHHRGRKHKAAPIHR